MIKRLETKSKRAKEKWKGVRVELDVEQDPNPAEVEEWKGATKTEDSVILFCT